MHPFSRREEIGQICVDFLCLRLFKKNEKQKMKKGTTGQEKRNKNERNMEEIPRSALLHKL